MTDVATLCVLSVASTVIANNLQTWAKVLSCQGCGHEMAQNLSCNHSILFKIASVETFSNVDYTHLIHLGFIVIKKILESDNAKELRFCLDKSLVIYRK